jgi:hypothetical protein
MSNNNPRTTLEMTPGQLLDAGLPVDGKRPIRDTPITRTLKYRSPADRMIGLEARVRELEALVLRLCEATGLPPTASRVALGTRSGIK